MANTTIISSPGKVLAAGGYLVLDPAYSGVVISTSSRFYSVIQDQGGANRIRVRSPQFIDAVWNYSVELKDKSIKVEQIVDR
jgi:phosphomevalonate kinase